MFLKLYMMFCDIKFNISFWHLWERYCFVLQMNVRPSWVERYFGYDIHFV